MAYRRGGRNSIAASTLAILAGGLAIWTSEAASAAAQRTERVPGSTRRTTTVTSLLTYPIFFHAQPVRVRGELSGLTGELPWRVTGDGRELLVVPGTNSRIDVREAGPTAVDITGVFLDVGRLEQGHPRATQTLLDLSQKLVKKAWPAPGELLVLVADTAVAAEPLAAPSLRAVALDPGRYAGQEVSVVGRFRGRNLYGDLPDAPGLSRWDFVLQSADASIWVTGRRPRAEGVDLSPERRADTGRWLEVRGLVKEERGLVRLEAVDVRLAQPPAAVPDTETVQLPEKGPPPEVVFSAPTQEETDVATNVTLRIQFSRDLDPETLKGQIRVGYVGFAPGDPNWEPPAVIVKYDEGRRVMEVRFAAPLEPLRTVQVRLLEGIKGTDAQPLRPWTLTFTVGPR